MEIQKFQHHNFCTIPVKDKNKLNPPTLQIIYHNLSPSSFEHHYKKFKFMDLNEAFPTFFMIDLMLRNLIT
jgi:hypothetical protein